MNLRQLQTVAIFEFVFNIFQNTRYEISALGHGTTNRNPSVLELSSTVEFRTEDIVNIAMDLVELHVEHVAATEFKLKMISQNFNARIAIKMVPLNAASASNLLISTK